MEGTVYSYHIHPETNGKGNSMESLVPERGEKTESRGRPARGVSEEDLHPSRSLL